jgi:cytochrome c-type biogenesis protein CcmE
MKRKHKRLAILLLGLAALGGASALVLAAFSDNLVFFYSPSELAAKPLAAGQRIRIGGLVETHSLAHEDGGRVAFRVTDGKTDMAVAYDGVLPDLFREGQGVVAEGRLGAGGIFVASTVLAKHDERYMPPEVVDALKKSGHWQEGGGDPSVLAGPPPAHVPQD